MTSRLRIHEQISAFHDRLASDPHHRYRSWEHCYRFFRSRPPEALLLEKDAAALVLGFYLASWGMYRGSSFLLQRAYTVHTAVVERLGSPEFSTLWTREVGSHSADTQLAGQILDAVRAVKEAYAPFGTATDTLATKVLLGTIACVPACDRLFIEGFKASGRPYSYLNGRFVQRIIEFCVEFNSELRGEQARIEAAYGIRYPLMKLADMFFWEVGYQAAMQRDREVLD